MQLTYPFSHHFLLVYSYFDFVLQIHTNYVLFQYKLSDKSFYTYIRNFQENIIETRISQGNSCEIQYKFRKTRETVTKPFAANSMIVFLWPLIKIVMCVKLAPQH